MSCYGPDGAPIPCGGYTIYNSYVTDPLYARYYLGAWAGLLGVAMLLALPAMYSHVRGGNWMEQGWMGRFGVYEEGKDRYEALPTESPPPRTTRLVLPASMQGVRALVHKLARSTLVLPLAFNKLPLFRPSSADSSCHPTRPLLPFSYGTLALALLIPAFILSTLFPESQLVANPNRFGFLALASLPPLFLLSSKSSPIAWLTGYGWTAVNFLHRWLGRAIIVLVFLHAYFWTVQWVASRQVLEFLAEDMQVTGLTAFAFLVLIGLSSIRPIRKCAYGLFYILHYVGIIGFLVFVNKHTPYASGYATYSIAFIYAADMLGRVTSMRIRYVEVEALEGGMTRVGLRGLAGGWRAGEHVSLRLFFTPPTLSIWSAFRLFEAHPFSIANAPANVGVLTATDDGVNAAAGAAGMDLYIRACAPGSWSADLHSTAQLAALVSANADAATLAEKPPKQLLHMLALVTGPYGGLGEYTQLDEENQLLVAGGSGMSFVLGVLDEMVGRRIRERRGGKIQVVWAVRERAQVSWFEKPLAKIMSAAQDANLDLSVSLKVFVTCDPTLTTISPTPTSPAVFAPAQPIAETISIPHTLLLFSRPLLKSVVDETIESALAPCGKCWPICHCGEGSGKGICSNDQGGCCGSQGLSAEDGSISSGDDKYESEEDDHKELEVEELDKMPNCCSSKVKAAPESNSSCCSSKSSSAPAYTPVLEEKKSKTGCCAPDVDSSLDESPLSVLKSSCGGCCAATGAGCCSGAIVGQDEEKRSGPMKIRTGGLGVVVCGPGGMMRELRQAVAEVALGKEKRIGGIQLHCEHFSL